MSEDLAKQLASYKAQLQQVEAALSGNAENEDLLKLKKDLQEVIELTKDLLSTQPSETLASSDSSASALPSHSWKVGDRCMAIWSEDGQCYEAEIEEIDEENGTAAITFAGYGNAEVTPLFNLKPVEEGRKAKEDSGNKPMSKKEMIAQQREYKKKKALKKAQRIKELEQEREDQKVKWQQFNNRAYSKNKKGQVKRSIFASPESVTGKVGVGTCGIADKPMTQYQDTSKYNSRCEAQHSRAAAARRERRPPSRLVQHVELLRSSKFLPYKSTEDRSVQQLTGAEHGQQDLYY